MGFVHFKQVRFFIFLWKFRFKSLSKSAFFVDLPTAFLFICLLYLQFIREILLCAPFVNREERFPSKVQSHGWRSR